MAVCDLQFSPWNDLVASASCRRNSIQEKFDSSAIWLVASRRQIVAHLKADRGKGGRQGVRRTTKHRVLFVLESVHRATQDVRGFHQEGFESRERDMLLHDGRAKPKSDRIFRVGDRSGNGTWPEQRRIDDEFDMDTA